MIWSIEFLEEAEKDMKRNIEIKLENKKNPSILSKGMVEDKMEEEKKPEILQTEKMEDKCYWILMNLQSTHS